MKRDTSMRRTSLHFLGRFVRPLGLLLLAAALLAPSALRAESLWWHNGSVMLLHARGDQRIFEYYEPRRVLQAAGVRPGTLLFNGSLEGKQYRGTARVFSKHCLGAPLAYAVSGQHSSETKIVLTGTREVHTKCKPTGRSVQDRLIFTYIRPLGPQDQIFASQQDGGIVERTR
jgi:hypothetical protein